jgi:hypothetical protein
MSTIFEHIKDLLIFYVKTHYDNYLKQKGIQKIPKETIRSVVQSVYSEKKDHVRTFILSSMKRLLNDEYPGDAIINNTLNDIFEDEDTCVNKLVLEIQLHQNDTI